MLAILNEVKTILEGTHFIRMEEIAPNSWILFFDKGKLFIALKGPFARFHLTQLPFKGKISKLTHSLARQKLVSMTLVNHDRILSLKFSSGEQLIFEFIPGGKLLLTRDYQPKVRHFEHAMHPSMMTSQELEERVLKAMETDWQQKWHKKNERKILHFKQEIEEGKKWQETAHEAELLQAYFFRLKKGMEKIELEDWEKEGEKVWIFLNPMLDPQEELRRRFKKSRVLKRKREMAEKLLEKTKAQSPPPFPFPLKKTPSTHTKPHPYREFTSREGFKIYVGKKDRDNDQLTFSFARGSDYWFHAANVAGSHVVLKVHKSETPNEETIQDALQLALYYSKARGMEEEVMMSQVKYLSKPKGAKPGLVNVSKHKKYTVRPNLTRLAELLP